MTDRDKCAAGALLLGGVNAAAAGFLVALPVGLAVVSAWFLLVALLLGGGGN